VRRATLFTLLGTALLLAGCASGSGKPASGGSSGGSNASGGTAGNGSGGTAGSGGTSVASSGGSGGAGGSGSGGAAGSGSTSPATGGRGSGGSTASGGSGTAGSSGGAGGSGVGGAASSGGGGGGGGTAGATGSGGRVVTGGTSGFGGAAGAGGTVGAGGTAGSGGTTGSGGADAGTACDLPTKFEWSSTAPIIVPVSDATHPLTAVKDPSVVRYGDRWHVFASSVSAKGAYSMIYTSFADWADAAKAPFSYLDQTPGLNGYLAAPQVFYFAPKQKWYLVYQSGPPMYSTTSDIGNPKSWTAPAKFYASDPAIITTDGWLDFWVICDAQNCYMFSSNDKGRWYRSKTSVSSFPAGFGDPVIVLEDAEAGRVFEASNVYKVNGTNKYLALIEAYDSTSNWKRYFRSWTATSLDGPWTVLNNDATSPFAGNQNVTFAAGAWTADISHGEMVRSGYDETMTIDACHLQYLYQGLNSAEIPPDAGYNDLPWKLGLLTAQ
jgi:endo-1,4-beta-xylanase